MQDGALIAGLVSAVALVLSVLFLARQTRESARQSLLANQLAGLQAKSEIYSTVDRILYQFLQFPHLRKYFYEGKEIPAETGTGVDVDARDQVLTFAELFCDAIERGSTPIGQSNPPEIFVPQWIPTRETSSRAPRRFAT